jgi:hypothetical protein
MGPLLGLRHPFQRLADTVTAGHMMTVAVVDMMTVADKMTVVDMMAVADRMAVGTEVAEDSTAFDAARYCMGDMRSPVNLSLQHS